MCSVLISGNGWCCTSNNNLNGTSHKQTPPQNDFYPSSQTLPSPFSSSRFYCRAVLFRPNLIDSHMPFCKLVAVIYIKRITLFTLTSANGRRRHRRMWEVVMWSRYEEIVVKIGKIVMLNKQTNNWMVLFDLCHQLTDSVSSSNDCLIGTKIHERSMPLTSRSPCAHKTFNLWYAIAYDTCILYWLFINVVNVMR